MELSDYHDYLETGTLKLSATHFPLPCTLYPLVAQRYSDPESCGSGAQAMQLEELLDYLQQIEEFDVPTTSAVLQLAERMGDPALPALEHLAVLRWLDEAVANWRTQFRLEDPLAGEVAALIPLIAAIALTDNDFFAPGSHPLHKVLDDTHTTAIGWQPALGRAGEALLQLVRNTVAQARAWFEDRETDLTAVCIAFSMEAARQKARTRRMIQRTVETEQGRLRAAEAKHTAGLMINANLSRYDTPAEIGEFLKGPWYASAQLVLLKFGDESDQWRQMSEVTDALLDSLQIPAEDDGSRRQHIFEAVTQLPKDLKRWLLSMHHDSDAVADVLSLVERAHLRVLRQQPLELVKVAPIALKESAVTAELPALPTTLETGQWFCVDTGSGDPLRVQLVLNIEREQRMLFANQAGIKPLQFSCEEFAVLLDEHKAEPLGDDAGISFSLCLAGAAGVDSTDALEQFLPSSEQRAENDSPNGSDEANGQQQASKQEPTAELALPEEAPLAQNERAEQREQQVSSLHAAPEIEIQLANEGQRWSEAEASIQRELPPDEPIEVHEPDVASLAGGGLQPEPGPVRQAEKGRQGMDDLPGSQQEIHLDLPMGAWVGFHDSEPPMLAKLAVYDREEDNYIFVNRQGIKLRQLLRSELRELIAGDRVQILNIGGDSRASIASARNARAEQ